MKMTQKKTAFLLIFAIAFTLALPETRTAHAEETLSLTVAQSGERQLSVTVNGVEHPEELSKDNFKITEYYLSEYGEFSCPWELDDMQFDIERNTIILDGHYQLVDGFVYVVEYVSSIEGTMSAFSGSITASEWMNETVPGVTAYTVVLKNQEDIYIPSGAAFSDGTEVRNIRDIAKWAFSYMTADGTLVVPTYEANATGIADIADVKYYTVKGAKAVIIQSVFFKVYLDPNNDNWVTAAEKAEDALGYYLLEVPVDRTLTVEDWSIVTN